MSNLSQETFQQGIAKLQAVFPATLSELQAAAYYQACCRLINSAFHHAVDRHIETGRTFPKPADLRELGAAYRIAENRERIAYSDDRYLPEHRKNQHAIDAQRAIALMFSPAPREHKLELFRVMERAYPGIGWAKEGKALQDYYDARQAT